MGKRCTGCGEKGKVKEAYHVVCGTCARKSDKCAKCLDPRSLDQLKKEKEGDQVVGEKLSDEDSDEV